MKKIKIKVADIMIAILLVFALLIFYLTKDWKEASYIMGFGPGFYPRVLSTILIGLLIILFFEEMAKSRKFKEKSIPEKKEDIKITLEVLLRALQANKALKLSLEDDLTGEYCC